METQHKNDIIISRDKHGHPYWMMRHKRDQWAGLCYIYGTQPGYESPIYVYTEINRNFGGTPTIAAIENGVVPESWPYRVWGETEREKNYRVRTSKDTDQKGAE